MAGRECKSCGQEYAPWDHGAGNLERFTSGMDRAAYRVDFLREALHRYGRDQEQPTVDRALEYAAALIRAAAESERQRFRDERAAKRSRHLDER